MLRVRGYETSKPHCRPPRPPPAPFLAVHTMAMAITIGQGAVAGGAALGLGALAFYGLGMSGEVGAVDRAVGWPQYVKDRVRKQFFVDISCSSIKSTLR